MSGIRTTARVAAFLVGLFVLGSLAAGRAAAEPAAPGPRPNIVLFLADDLGYGELGCYGNTAAVTPNLDRFAAEGLRLTDCHSASSVCSPSRSSLLTGRTPYRNGVFTWIPEGSPIHLRAGERALPKLLRKAGYDTCHVGKWHLNGKFNSPEQPQPDAHGYAWWLGTQNNAAPSHAFPKNFVRNGEPVGRADDHSAPFIAREAVTWLAERRDASKPFFLAVWTHEPHYPIASAERYQARHAGIADPVERAYRANVTQLDDAFGIVLAALAELRLADDTLVFFTSDNGPEGDGVKGPGRGLAGPLRGRKRSMYEGGHRVPGILRWPGRIEPGRTSDLPVIGSDFFPTALAAAGVEPPAGVALDGVDILPALAGEPLERPVPLFWQWGGKLAWREGSWKLVADAGLSTPELYDLARDPGEQTNLATAEAARLAGMLERLRAYRAELAAEAPVWPAKQPRPERVRPERERPPHDRPEPAAAVQPAALRVATPADEPQGPPAGGAGAALTPRPNVVFILFDDLGYGESPAFRQGCEFKTPHLDRLAREGMRFTDAHSASAVCTPTRYGILTGRYPLRIGQNGVLTTFSGPIIRADDVTVGSLLQDHGYHTGCFGKWHLGMRWPAELARAGEAAVPLGTVVTEGPITRGFDAFLGFTHARNMGMIIEQDRVVAKVDPVEVQPLFVERAAAYVTQRAATGKPFFLYLPLAAPHTPIVPAETFQGTSGVGPYGDWIFQGDAAVGRILAALDEAGVAGNTLVIVTSDNGAAGRPYAPLRAAKTSIYEGGHRVPFVARWPGVIQPETTCSETICLNDLMATAADILAVELPADAGVDSFSLLPAFRGQPGPLREATIHQSLAGDRAIRRGDWKLIAFKTRGPDAAAQGLKKWSRQELYDLRADLGEARDLAAAQPAVATELRALLDATIARGRSRPGPPGPAPLGPPSRPATKKSGRPAGRPDR